MRVPEATEAFLEFQQNLNYARQLVEGGRRLAQLKVGAFDVDDLYRAAWVQAVAALDHWVTGEIVDRAVVLAQPGMTRPAKYSKLTISIDLFETVHHHQQPLPAVIRPHLEQFFGFMTFQNPDKIKEGLAYVSTVNLWPRVAQILNEQAEDETITADVVRLRLREIARRRNAIAHTADRDRETSSGRAAITADSADDVIDWLEKIATGILRALGPVTPAPDYDQLPEDADGLGEVPATRTVLVRGRSRWDENSLIESIKEYCTPEVAATLLAVYRHAETHPAFEGYYFGEAAYPSATAWFHMGNDEAAIWSIYTGVRKSTLSINFQWMRDRGASTDRLGRLAADLVVLPGWTRLPATLKEADYAKRPSLAQAALSAPNSKNIILDALGKFLTPNTVS
ncbi:hypothetical protein OG979_26855 [Actinomadura citrea]|uniref:hypothetical protein n=1 Tax=Actinomadura citrea TaxID=46158 RepID=UPI002E2C00B9|nr:hypothetical protein [Actinomadura citrea]